VHLNSTPTAWGRKKRRVRLDFNLLVRFGQGDCMLGDRVFPKTRSAKGKKGKGASKWKYNERQVQASSESWKKKAFWRGECNWLEYLRISKMEPCGEKKL